MDHKVQEFKSEYTDFATIRVARCDMKGRCKPVGASRTGVYIYDCPGCGKMLLVDPYALIVISEYAKIGKGGR